MSRVVFVFLLINLVLMAKLLLPDMGFSQEEAQDALQVCVSHSPPSDVTDKADPNTHLSVSFSLQDEACTDEMKSGVLIRVMVEVAA